MNEAVDEIAEDIQENEEQEIDLEQQSVRTESMQQVDEVNNEMDISID